MSDDTMERRRAVHEHDRVIMRPCEKLVFSLIRRRARVDLITQKYHHQPSQPNPVSILHTSKGEKKKVLHTHLPKVSSNLVASSVVKCTSVPFSACSFKTSLSVRFPELRCDARSASGGAEDTSFSPAEVPSQPPPPWEGNTTRLEAEAVVLALVGSVVGSG
jgi:hypothetical protein